MGGNPLLVQIPQIKRLVCFFPKVLEGRKVDNTKQGEAITVSVLHLGA